MTGDPTTPRPGFLYDNNGNKVFPGYTPESVGGVGGPGGAHIDGTARDAASAAARAADRAAQTADAAQGAADRAAQTADAAETAASNASTQATGANDRADAAAISADNANGSAQAASLKANSAIAKGDNAIEIADRAVAKADANNETIVEISEEQAALSEAIEEATQYIGRVEDEQIDTAAALVRHGSQLCPEGIRYRTSFKQRRMVARGIQNDLYVTFDRVLDQLDYAGDPRRTFIGERFFIDPTVPLKIRSLVKGTPGTFIYDGLQFYDSLGDATRGEVIMHQPGTATALVAPFGPNDTVMRVVSLDAWSDNANDDRCIAILPPVGLPVSGLGVPFIKGSTPHTDYASPDFYVIDKAAKELRFIRPLKAVAFKDGQTWPVGTIVRQAVISNQNLYNFSRFTIPDDGWHYSEKTFQPFNPATPSNVNQLIPTAALARLIVLFNYGQVAGTAQSIRDIAVTQ